MKMFRRMALLGLSLAFAGAVARAAEPAKPAPAPAKAAPAPAKPAAAPAAKPAAAPAAKAAPKSTYRTELLGNFNYASGELEQLAAAIPAEKYGWRPAEGVRSVSEVVAHVAAGNYYVLAMAGLKTPEGIHPQDFEKETDKTKLLALLKTSDEMVRTNFSAATAAQLDTPVELFGHPTSVRGAYFIVMGHVHEHLGQLIAYARSNGVVPPWSKAPEATK